MKRRGWGLGIAGILAVASAGAAWKVWRGQLGDLSLAEEIAAAKREGVPLSSQDLQEPEIQSGENAAGPYLLATANARAIMKSGAWHKQFSRIFPRVTSRTLESLSSTERAKLRALIAPYAPAFTLLREAGRRPKMVLNRPWNPGMALEDVPAMTDLIRILSIRANLRDLEGDTKGALADIEVSALATAQLHAAKSLMEGFARGQNEKLILDTLNQIAARHPHDPQMPRRIRRTVSQLGPSLHLRRLLFPQLVDDRQILAYLSAGGDTCMPGSPWLRLRSVRDANKAYLISYWRKVFACIPEDPLAFDRARRAMEAVFEEYDEAGTLRTAGLSLQNYAGSAGRLAEFESLRRVTLSAADILERWQREGHLPTSPPVLRQDPFGKDLRYFRTAQGFAIYSLGADRRDDGGKQRAIGYDEEGNRETADIAWRIDLPLEKLRVSATIPSSDR